MSRRRRGAASAISLFSFQDIITSVTAIVILLVLILTLELVLRTQKRGGAQEDRRVAHQLQRAVAAMERQAATLKAELAAAQVNAVRGASFSESDTLRREQVASKRADELAEEISLLERELRSAVAKRRSSEGELLTTQQKPTESADHVAAMVARAAEIEQANAAEEARQKANRAKGAGASGAKTLVFNKPPGESLTPRLLEVSQDGLAAVVPGQRAPVRFSDVDRGFKRWLERIDRHKEYVVVVLRPSGIDRYDDVVAAVREAGIALGSELVGESMTVSLGTGE